MKKGFTLIELLVVIAIIAILAAILFPAFARAKVAAKAAGSLSNAIQEGLATAIYVNDTDDTYPVGTTWNTGHDQLCIGFHQCFATWAWSLLPYTKSAGVFMDPLAASNDKRASGQDNFDTYYTQFGYNYAFLSPYYPANNPQNGNQEAQPVTTSYPVNPGKMIMFVSKWAQKTAGAKPLLDWATGRPGGMVVAAGIAPPNGNQLYQYVTDGWGANGFYSNLDGYHGLGLSPVEGGLSGGCASRANDTCVVLWTDGHASKLSLNALAAGTNWTPTIDHNAVEETDYTKYLWDSQ